MKSLSESGSRGWSRVKPWLPLAVITLVAAVLRLYHLGSWSVWVDEGHTWRDATAPFGAFWDSERASYPLSFLLVRIFDTLGIHDAGMLRLPFALIGIATVPILARTAVPMVGVRAALLAAFLLAINPWHIYWSQNARAYVLLLLFIVLASATCFEGVRRRSWRLIAVSLSLGVLAVLSHPSAYLMLGMLVAFLVLARSEGLRVPKLPRWGIGVVLVMVAGLVYLLAVSMGDLQTFARSKPNASLGHLLKTSAFYFRPLLLMSAACAAILVLRGRDRSGVFLVMWGVVPPVLLVLLPLVGVQVTARYGFVSLPAIILLASWLCVRMGDSLRPLGSRAVCLLLPLMLTVDSATYDYFYFNTQYGDRPRWAEAVDYLQSQSGDNWALLTTNEPTMNYYLRPGIHRGEAPGPLGEYSILEWEVTEAGGGEAYMESRLARANRQGKTLVVVITEPELEEKDPDGGVRKFLRERFHQVARFPNWVGPKDQTVLIYR